MSLQLSYVGHSEIGLVRKNNQDSGYASPTLLVVADGMGGAAAGDLASAVAIDEVRAADAELRAAALEASQRQLAAEGGADQAGVTDQPDADRSPGPEADRPEDDAEPIAPDDVTLAPAEMLDSLAGIVSRANDRIADLVAADHSLEGMGTTLDAGMFDGEQLALAHIGDSRVYLQRSGELTRLTHDHSWVQSLVDDGRISLEEAAYHPHRSLLLKVLNGQPANDPDLSTHRLLAGDRLLFCSDGLCGLVEDAVLASILAEPDPEVALRQLVAAAHAEGGIDNITVLVADVVEAGAALPEVMVLGAAGSTDIPDVSVHPRQVDLGDDADEDTAAHDHTTTHDKPGAALTPPPGGSPTAGSPTTPARTASRSPSSPSGGRDADAESDRYALRAPPPARRRVLRVLVSLVLVVGLLGGLGAGAVAWGRTQYFVGAAQDNVAIYRGLPDEVGGLALNQVYQIQQTPIADLPLLFQERVRGTVEVADLAAAERTVAELATVSEECIAQREARAEATESPTPTPGDDPSGTPGSSEDPEPTDDPDATGSAQPSPQESAAASPAPTTPPVDVGC